VYHGVMQRRHLHGDFHRTGTARWGAECRKWVNVMEWDTEHINHGNYRADVGKVLTE